MVITKTEAIIKDLDGIAKRLGVNQASIHNHLLKMPALANLINSDLENVFDDGILQRSVSGQQ